AVRADDVEKWLGIGNAFTVHIVEIAFLLACLWPRAESLWITFIADQWNEFADRKAIIPDRGELRALVFVIDDQTIPRVALQGHAGHSADVGSRSLPFLADEILGFIDLHRDERDDRVFCLCTACQTGEQADRGNHSYRKHLWPSRN